MDKVNQSFGDKLYAPFTTAQIDKIREFQKQPSFHGFTCCGYEGCTRPAPQYGELTPTQSGMVCPCGKYTQTWVYKIMATCLVLLLSLGSFAQNKKYVTSTTSEPLRLLSTQPSTYRQIQIQNGTSREYISIGQVNSHDLTFDKMSASHRDTTIVKHIVVHTDSLKATIYFHGVVDSVLFHGQTYYP